MNTSYFTLKEGVKMYGGFAATEAALTDRDSLKIHAQNETILDGSKGAASYHVVYNAAAISNATVLDGFTVSGGNAASSGVNSYGGGIYTSLGSPIFNNLLIKGNAAAYGAGAFVNSGTVSFTNSQFINNTTSDASGRGAALYNNNSGTVIITGSSFENNKVGTGTATYGGALMNYGNANLNQVSFKNNSVAGSPAQGGAIYNSSTGTLKIQQGYFEGNTAVSGGAIYNYSMPAELTDVTFKDNRSSGNGGALYLGGTPTLNRIYFIANEAVQHGGAIYATGAAKLDNVVFSRNKVTSTGAYYGGAIYSTGNAILTNVTFSNNSIGRTAAGGGAFYRAGGTPVIYNSIFWGNTRFGNISDQISGLVTIDNSIVQDGYATGTNILIGNPLFVNASTDNLRIKGGSPAINSGDNAKTSTPQDIEGNPRIFDGVVDMGAYENQGSESLTILPASIQAYNRGDKIEIPFTVSGNHASETLVWTMPSGSLPNGLVLKPDGELSGRPMQSGNYTFVISVTNGELVGSKQFTLQVNNNATRWFVNTSATGRNDGSDWTNGFTDLKNAISKALAGDEIWVAKGSYSPGPLATDWFTMKDGVKIYGGFAATEETLEARDLNQIHTQNNTVLNGNEGAASRHVVFNNIALSNATLLDGFTISGGKTLTGGDTDNHRGGGIYNYAQVKASFSNLHIENNTADRGAGIYNLGAATFSNILFERNMASAYGGGMYNLNANISLTDVVFKENSSTLQAGGLATNGGVVALMRVAFNGNTAGQQAGGMHHVSGTANLENVVFSRNRVTTLGNYYGGGMYLAANATLNNVSFSNNSIAYTHVSTFGGAGLYRSAGTVTVYNSIFWGNARGNGVADQLAGTVTVGNSLVQGGYSTGTNILIGDPLFVDPANDNLLLKGGSPAIDVGDNIRSTSNLDIAGKPRLVNDIIDLGAYENQGGAALIIQQKALGPFTRGTSPNLSFAASGGSSNYTWALQSGTLPIGLTVNSSGFLGGNPTVPGFYTFVIAVTDG
ncbi:MAG TPA: choice-of-anchor Q domain-containing protein [Flavisolibacter sp.]|nr:choice-of-anchor Q domain-containing protein [Flavisolibacter sp.]